MEKLIESLPVMQEISKNPDGTPNNAGLCIRYSVSNSLWIAGYGRRRTIGDPYVGSGYSIIEAVDDLKRKQKKPNGTGKN